MMVEPVVSMILVDGSNTVMIASVKSVRQKTGMVMVIVMTESSILQIAHMMVEIVVEMILIPRTALIAYALTHYLLPSLEVQLLKPIGCGFNFSTPLIPERFKLCIHISYLLF